MTIIVCNVGSTSLKFKCYKMPEETLLSSGKIERVGSETDAIYSYKNEVTGFSLAQEGQSIPDYTTGINRYLKDFTGERGALGSIGEIDGVVFKCPIAAGFPDTHPVSEDLFAGMDEYMAIAGTHNTPTIKAIRLFREILPDVPMVCAFETGFHQSIPMERRIWGLPWEWYEKYGIYRRGYHGASHNYIADKVAEIAQGPFRLISCHLGGSSSVCGIRDGKSADVSWGFSLQTGLPHGYRAGDTDSSLVNYLMSRGLSPQEINEGITRKGGLLGISGVSEDMRYIEEAAEQGNERARLAIDVFCENIIKYIGGFYAEMGGMDYLTFTAGVGENSSLVRKKVCDRLFCFGVELDPEKNDLGKGAPNGLISKESSRVKVYVWETNEELNVARRASRYLSR